MEEEIKKEKKQKVIKKGKIDDFFSKYALLFLYICFPLFGFWIGLESSLFTKQCPTAPVCPQENTSKEPVEVPVPEVSTYKYSNKSLHFAFEYPFKWGAVQYTYDPQIIPRDESLYEDITIENVQNSRWYIDFTEKQCEQAGDCWVGVQVYGYDNEHFLKLTCDESECTSLDLTEDKELVAEKYNNVTNTIKWLCEDGALTSRSILALSCRAYIGNELLKISTGYFVENLDEVLETCGNDLNDVVCVSEYVADGEDYKKFRNDSIQMLQSFSILETENT